MACVFAGAVLLRHVLEGTARPRVSSVLDSVGSLVSCIEYNMGVTTLPVAVVMQ
jgi:hypothetical protein